MSVAWSWLFGLLSLFLWSNVCGDALQRQLFVNHYGKFSGFSYSTQQFFYIVALISYFVPSMFGYQTNVSFGFELLSLFYFALVELLFWVKQSFRWAGILQLSALMHLCIGVLWEFFVGTQDQTYKILYAILRMPLEMYFVFYFLTIQTYLRYSLEKPTLYREHGRFTDFNSTHVNANSVFVLPNEGVVVRKHAMFQQN